MQCLAWEFIQSRILPAQQARLFCIMYSTTLSVSATGLSGRLKREISIHIHCKRLNKASVSNVLISVHFSTTYT